MDLSAAKWRKSTRSGPDGGQCVEVATNLSAVVAVRDSKDRGGPALVFSQGEWHAFISDLKTSHHAP
ncbi:DUF397 domain-containing protein [Sphaerisporangium sp. NBC_01403]|uniref:DUF397 domain-containing protein n=1 Tax=Sphaerisporangium sp. NBC_01403 TaxID=2903599 RepID=UPI00324FD3F7